MLACGIRDDRFDGDPRPTFCLKLWVGEDGLFSLRPQDALAVSRRVLALGDLRASPRGVLPRCIGAQSWREMTVLCA